ncbi:MAG TPA: hypothetical protein VGP72_05495 [Planctomycetota bacterium]|jgi:hypothetical protein
MDQSALLSSMSDKDRDFVVQVCRALQNQSTEMMGLAHVALKEMGEAKVRELLSEAVITTAKGGAIPGSAVRFTEVHECFIELADRCLRSTPSAFVAASASAQSRGEHARRILQRTTWKCFCLSRRPSSDPPKISEIQSLQQALNAALDYLKKGDETKARPHVAAQTTANVASAQGVSLPNPPKRAIKQEPVGVAPSVQTQQIEMPTSQFLQNVRAPNGIPAQPHNSKKKKRKKKKSAKNHFWVLPAFGGKKSGSHSSGRHHR